MRLRFDHGPAGGATLFDGAERVIRCTRPEDAAEALAALDAARAQGFWLAGYVAYDFGLALEPRLLPLMPARRAMPLLQFGLYEDPAKAGPLPAPSPMGITQLSPLWSQARYAAAFERLKAYIAAGDTYQVNLTFPLEGRYDGSAGALYAALAQRQAVRHGVLVEGDGLPTILSRSPELFFRTDSAGRIETRPMKGTAPRSADPIEDARQAAFLAGDEKNRAENLMIVDLLRNDISRICEVGSVKVPSLFEIEHYATVHQMVSTVVGQMRPNTALSEIVRALFPCGSITGAPKLRAMQIIAELEDSARDIYCGSIGWAAPDGRSEFNVAIRSPMLWDGKLRLNVGGGIVHDSTAEAEYEEALWKAAYAQTDMTPQPTRISA